jgi:hypothetical protein
MPLTTVDQGLLSTNAQYTGFKNRIINGDMVIDQRNAGASVTINSGTAQYPVDRFGAYGQSTDGVFTVQQSTNAPAGFTNSLIATVTTADASIGSIQEYGIFQSIEGLNVADLGWGTANAQPVTLSFWARSSVTGTQSGALTNSAFARAYGFSYTISAANTWEYKTITIAGDTSGTWLTNNGVGIRIRWNLGTGSSYLGTAGSWGGFLNGTTGSVQLISTLNATFQITGVQLEKGSTATSFDVLPYGTELQLCQRYYYRVKPQSAGRYCLGRIESSTNARGLLPFPTTMRVAPSALDQTGTATDYGIAYAGTGTACSSVPAFDGATTESVARISFTISSGMTQGQVCDLYNVNANGYLGWSAEL